LAPLDAPAVGLQGLSVNRLIQFAWIHVCALPATTTIPRILFGPLCRRRASKAMRLTNQNASQAVQIPERPLKVSELDTEILMLRGVQHVFTTAHFQSVY